METNYKRFTSINDWKGKFVAELDPDGKPYLILEITNPRTASGNVTLNGKKQNITIEQIIKKIDNGSAVLFTKGEVFEYFTKKFFNLYFKWEEMVKLMRENLWRFGEDRCPTFLDSMKAVIDFEFTDQYINFDMVIYDQKTLNDNRQYFKNSSAIKKIWAEYGYDGKGIN